MPASAVSIKHMIEMLMVPLRILWGEGLLSYQPAIQLVNQIPMNTMLYIELPEKQQAHSLRIFRDSDPVLIAGQHGGQGV
jgi:hypothetical protein